MYLSDRNVWIVPMEDARIQLIITLQDSIKTGESMCDGIMRLMSDIDESKLQQLPNLCIPSFSLEVRNETVGVPATTFDDIKVGSTATHSSSINLIPGKPSSGALLSDTNISNVVDSPFIFAIHDQELERNEISSQLILAARVDKKCWTKA